MRWIPIVFAAALSLGCVSQSSLDGFGLPVGARRSGATFAVLHQPQDERRLDRIIADSLRARGLDASADATDPTDYLVSYVDRWQWDMRMYLIDLRIDIRDAKTNVLLATGRSYQTSLAAMGETHQGIVERAVDVLVEGMDAPRARREAARPKNHSRRK